jgi:3-oxoadipate enol-lactonase
MEALSARHRVLRPDLRGFGDSPLPGGPFSYVEDVRALLDRLGLDRVAVVGNSFGGRVALDFALTYGDRTRALVLAAPALGGHDGSAELDAFDEEEDALLEAGRLDEAVALNLRTWLDGYGREAAPVSAEERARVAAMQRRSLETALAAYERMPPPGPVSWAEPPAATRLHEVAVPALVVRCAYDHPDFRAIAGLLAEGIPDAELVDLETGHLPAFEQPDEFNRLALEFLREI